MEGESRSMRKELAGLYYLSHISSVIILSHLILQLFITSTTQFKKLFPVEKITKRRKEANQDREKIGVGTSVTVKVGEIDEKIMEAESRSMRKELAGLYYLSHISFVLMLSHFWFLVLVFSVVYIW